MINSFIRFCQKTARPFIETLTLAVSNHNCSSVVMAKIHQCMSLSYCGTFIVTLVSVNQKNMEISMLDI